MDISVVGINHHTAPVRIRERVALPGDLPARLLHVLREENVLEEALVLDTCNRTEAYFVSGNGKDPLPYLLDRIARLKNSSSGVEPSIFYRYQGASAAAHLFQVAASLDSQILGEPQILGQVKNAYRLALEAGTAGFLMNKLLPWALRVGKRVRTDTALCRGSTSIAQAAVKLAFQVFPRLTDRAVLLIGAGRTAELCARALIRRGADRVIIANRTAARAQEVAQALRERRPAKEELSPDAGGRTPPPVDFPHLAVHTIALEEVPAAIPDVDVVISSTGSPEVILGPDALQGSPRPADRPLLVVDIAVPRDVDPTLGDMPNVYLYNIDDLNCLVDRNIERRRKEIPRAQAIVDHEARRFGEWRDSLRLAPTIKLLRRRLALLQEEELRKYRRKFLPTDRAQLERFTRSLCAKIFHKPLDFLEALSENSLTGEDLAAIAAVRRIFELDSLEIDG